MVGAILGQDSPFSWCQNMFSTPLEPLGISHKLPIQVGPLFRFPSTSHDSPLPSDLGLKIFIRGWRGMFPTIFFVSFQGPKKGCRAEHHPKRPPWNFQHNMVRAGYIIAFGVPIFPKMSPPNPNDWLTVLPLLRLVTPTPTRSSNNNKAQGCWIYSWQRAITSSVNWWKFRGALHFFALSGLAIYNDHLWDLPSKITL